jgi:phage tail sheath protein FI
VPNYLSPGVYVEERPGGPRPIEAVGTSTFGVVGKAPAADKFVNQAIPVQNWLDFVRKFVPENGGKSTPLSHAVYGFFRNGGTRCYVVNVGDGPVSGGGTTRSGVDVLETVDEVAIVAAPGYTDLASTTAVLDHCERLRDRVAILDGPATVPNNNVNLLTQVMTAQPRRARSSGDSGEGAEAAPDTSAGGLRPRQSDNGFGAFYFPWLLVKDPLDATVDNVAVPPSGHLAGIWARSDATRGVHKAPANEVVREALGLTYQVTHAEQEELNPAGVNVIRSFPGEGVRVWGARTVAASSGEFKYLNVRRLFSMVEESIARSMRWVVFEPNDMQLWGSIRRDVSAFLTRLWRDGALFGAAPEEAFFVKCDAETNPAEEIDAGRVTTIVGMAPVKPAEFIVFQISQYAAGTEIQTA